MLIAVPTRRLTVQLLPPIATAKLAVPDRVGTPRIAKRNCPFPVPSVPEESTAVNPGTPVEAMLISGYRPPLPPVYNRSVYTVLSASAPIVRLPRCVAAEQFKAPSDARTASTVRSTTQVCPPKVRVNLAVPVVSGVPLIDISSVPVPFVKIPPRMLAVRPPTPVDPTV